MNLLRHLSIYTFVGFLGGLIGLIVMPILTHYLSPADYGILALFNTYVLMIIPIIGFVASGLISVEFFNKSLSKKKFRSLFSSISFIPIIPFIAILILGVLFRNQLEELIDIPAKYIFFIPLLAFFTVYSEQFFGFLVTTKKALLYGVGNVSKTILEVILTLIFVVGMGMGWQGRINSWLIIAVLFFLVAGYYFFSQKLLTLNIRKEYIKSGLIFGSPLVLHTFGKLIVNQSDRIFIAKMISLDAVGIYNTGYMVGSILLIVSGAFINVYTPFLYERLADITDIKKIEIVRISYVFLFALSLALFFVTFFAPFLYKHFVDPKYSSGTIYVFWIGLSYLFWGGYLMFAGFLFYNKNTKTLAGLAIVNVILNLGFNYLLINKYGTIGAAYATALSFLIILVLVIIISNRKYAMPWFRFKQIIYGVD